MVLYEKCELETLFKEHLRDGEELLWVGQSADGARLREHGSPPALLAFALIWTFFSIWLIVETSAKGGFHPVMLIFPAIAVGLFALTFLYKKELYAVTNERVMVLHKGSLRCVELSFLRNIRCYCSPRNIGCITMEQINLRNHKGKAVELEFKAVSEPNEAYEILKKLRDEK